MTSLERYMISSDEDSLSWALPGPKAAPDLDLAVVMRHGYALYSTARLRALSEMDEAEAVSREVTPAISNGLSVLHFAEGDRKALFSPEPVNLTPFIKARRVFHGLKPLPKAFSEEALVIVSPEKTVGPPSNRPRQSAPFSPSWDLCGYLRYPAEVSPDEDVGSSTERILNDAKAAHIKQALLGLLQTISDSLDAAQGQTSYLLSNGQRFEEPFARALLFRLHIGLYDQIEFLTKLHTEMQNALLASEGWEVRQLLNGSMSLAALPSKKPLSERSPRQRAKAIKPKMAYSTSDR